MSPMIVKKLYLKKVLVKSRLVWLNSKIIFLEDNGNNVNSCISLRFFSIFCFKDINRERERREPEREIGSTHSSRRIPS